MPKNILTNLGNKIVTGATSLGLLATPIAGQTSLTSHQPSLIVGGKFNNFPESYLSKIPYLLVPQGSRSVEFGLQHGNLAGLIRHYTDRDNLVQEITASNITQEGHTLTRKGTRDFNSLGGSLEYQRGPFSVGVGADIWRQTNYSIETDVQRENKNILVFDPVIDDRERTVNTNSKRKSGVSGRWYLGIRALRNKPVGLGLIAGVHKKGFYTNARLYFNLGKGHRR